MDFCNTLDPREGDHARDFLQGYGDLVAWARHARSISAVTADQLAGAGNSHPRLGREVFRQAIELRESLYTVFGGIATRATLSGDL